MGVPRVALFTMGGTIAMAGGSAGVVPRLGGQDLLSAVDRFLGGISVEVHDVRAVPSADLTFRDVLDVVERAVGLVDAGADGIVLTQGTDTLEESAFLVDQVWPGECPFVVTGAMRNPTLAGPDGPANVVAAIEVAAATASRSRGALVVFNDEIHAARHVRKAHSTSPAAFVSPDLGPIGQLVEGAPRFRAETPREQPVAGVDLALLATTRVALYTATMDDDGAILGRLAETHQGLVVAGFGVGHVPGRLAPVLGDLADVIPVVLTSRAGAGSVLTNTYGAIGSERDLLGRGLVNGGLLHPYKARVLLRLLIAAGASRDRIAAAFAARG